jgi:hypothetical protein
MATTNTIIGIDPGKSGGVAWILPGPHDTGYGALPMPETERDLYELIANRDETITVFVEKVNAGPRMGSSAAFKFGQSVGAIRMACVAAGVRLEYVSPQKWQKALGLIVSGRGLGQNDTAKKNRNKARAQELFPGLKLTLATCDAILIAEYGRRQLAMQEYSYAKDNQRTIDGEDD